MSPSRGDISITLTVNRTDQIRLRLLALSLRATAADVRVRCESELAPGQRPSEIIETIAAELETIANGARS